MPPRTPYKLAADSIQTPPVYGLSGFDKARIDDIRKNPGKLKNGPQSHIETQAYLARMTSMDAQTPVLERMGAVLLLSSFIEGRIRAMYRDRHAIMHGLPRPTAAGEASAFAEAADAGRVLGSTPLDKDPVYRQLCQLRYYEDVDEATFKELKLFTEVRNAMVHDAMYRIAVFTVDVVHALLPMVRHLTNMRQKVRIRTNKERELHDLSPFRTDYFATLSPKSRLARDELFKRVAGSPSDTINAPLSFGRPLYVVAQGGGGAPKVRIHKEEWETHNLWSSFIDTDERMPVFRKVSVTDGSGPVVEYVGYGRLLARGPLVPGVVCDVVVE